MVRINLRYRSLFHWFGDDSPPRAPGVEVAPQESEPAQVGTVGNRRARTERECRRPFQSRIALTTVDATLLSRRVFGVCLEGQRLPP